MGPMSHEYAFEMAASSIRYGAGVTREVGMDLAEMRAERVMVLTDPHLARLPPVATVLELLSITRKRAFLNGRRSVVFWPSRVWTRGR